MTVTSLGARSNHSLIRNPSRKTGSITNWTKIGFAPGGGSQNKSSELGHLLEVNQFMEFKIFVTGCESPINFVWVYALCQEMTSSPLNGDIMNQKGICWTIG